MTIAERLSSTSAEWQEVGLIGVDAGCILIADPSYVLANDERGDSGLDFGIAVEPLNGSEGRPQPLGGQADRFPAMPPDTMGQVIPTGYGDGVYPVSVRHDPETGRVAAVMVTFIPSAADMAAIRAAWERQDDMA